MIVVITPRLTLRALGNLKEPIAVSVGTGVESTAAILTRQEAQDLVYQLTKLLARRLDEGENAKGVAKLPRRCGRYIGDNDATSVQLTCVRPVGHLGLCDNVSDRDD